MHEALQAEDSHDQRKRDTTHSVSSGPVKPNGLVKSYWRSTDRSSEHRCLERASVSSNARDRSRLQPPRGDMQSGALEPQGDWATYWAAGLA